MAFLFTKFEIFRENYIMNEGMMDNYEKHYSKTKLTLDEFEQIVKADPTSLVNDTQDKMGKYSKWLINLYLAGGFKLEDLYKATKYLKTFDKYKSKLSIKDINQVKTLPALFSLVEPHIDSEEPASNREAEKNIKKDAEKFYEDDDWTVIIPKSEEAACYYGKGTQWCTAATEGGNAFDSYNNDGYLFIFISKTKKDDQGRQVKYQLHIQSSQFMDVHDNPVSPNGIIPMRLFEKCMTKDNIHIGTYDYSWLKGELDHDKRVKIVEIAYNNKSRDAISKKFIEKILEGDYNLELGYYGFNQSSDLEYYLDEDMLNEIKESMKKDDTEHEFDIDTMSFDELYELLDDNTTFDSTMTRLKDVKRYADEIAWYNDFYKILDREINKLDNFDLMLISLGFENDDLQFEINEPNSGFDSDASKEDFKMQFKDYF